MSLPRIVLAHPPLAEMSEGDRSDLLDLAMHLTRHYHGRSEVVLFTLPSGKNADGTPEATNG